MSYCQRRIRLEHDLLDLENGSSPICRFCVTTQFPEEDVFDLNGERFPIHVRSEKLLLPTSNLWAITSLVQCETYFPLFCNRWVHLQLQESQLFKIFFYCRDLVPIMVSFLIPNDNYRQFIVDSLNIRRQPKPIARKTPKK